MLHGLTQTCAPHIRTTRAGSHGLTHARSLYRDRVSDAVSGVLGRDVGTHTPYRWFASAGAVGGRAGGPGQERRPSEEEGELLEGREVAAQHAGAPLGLVSGACDAARPRDPPALGVG